MTDRNTWNSWPIFFAWLRMGPGILFIFLRAGKMRGLGRWWATRNAWKTWLRIWVINGQR